MGPRGAERPEAVAAGSSNNDGGALGKDMNNSTFAELGGSTDFLVCLYNGSKIIWRASLSTVGMVILSVLDNIVLSSGMLTQTAAIDHR